MWTFVILKKNSQVRCILTDKFERKLNMHMFVENVS